MLSKVLAANWVGVTYFVRLSAIFNLVAIEFKIGVWSKVFAANWVGVTYWVKLSAMFTLLVTKVFKLATFAYGANIFAVSKLFNFASNPATEPANNA